MGLKLNAESLPDDGPKIHQPKKRVRSSSEKRTPWRAYRDILGARHRRPLMTLMEVKDGLTPSELAARLGHSRGYGSALASEMNRMGLTKYDGIREFGNHMAHILVLTEAGMAKAQWFLSEPGSKSQEADTSPLTTEETAPNGQ